MAAAEDIWMLKKVTTMIERLHTGMMINARNGGGDVSHIFAITNGINQGCVLAPTLFSIFLSAMLKEALKELGTEYTSNYARMHTSL